MKIVKPSPNLKNGKRGRHKTKTEEEFIAFFRKEFWNPIPETASVEAV
jgi:hypothetical protein